MSESFIHADARPPEVPSQLIITSESKVIRTGLALVADSTLLLAKLYDCPGVVSAAEGAANGSVRVRLTDGRGRTVSESPVNVCLNIGFGFANAPTRHR